MARPDFPNGRHDFFKCTSKKQVETTGGVDIEVGWKCSRCEQWVPSKKHHNLGPCPGKPLTADELALRKPASVEAAHGVL